MVSDIAMAARASWEDWLFYDDAIVDKPVYAGMFLLYDYIMCNDTSGKVISVYLEPSRVSDPWKVLTNDDNDDDKENSHICLNLHQNLTSSLSIETVNNNGFNIQLSQFFVSSRIQEQVPRNVLELFGFLKPKCECRGEKIMTICPQAFWRIALIDVWFDYLWTNATNEDRTLLGDLIALSQDDCNCIRAMKHEEMEMMKRSVRMLFFNKSDLDLNLKQIYSFFHHYLPKEIFWFLESRLPQYR